MEENRKPRNKLTYLRSINLQQSQQEYPMERKTVSSISGIGKGGFYCSAIIRGGKVSFTDAKRNPAGWTKG